MVRKVRSSGRVTLTIESPFWIERAGRREEGGGVPADVLQVGLLLNVCPRPIKYNLSDQFVRPVRAGCVPLITPLCKDFTKQLMRQRSSFPTCKL